MKENRHARNVLKKILNRTEQKNENPRYIRQLSVWCAYERSLNERFYFGILLVFASALSRKQKQNENSFDQRALMWTRSCFDGIDSKTFSIYFPYAINLRFFFFNIWLHSVWLDSNARAVIYRTANNSRSVEIENCAHRSAQNSTWNERWSE